MSGVLFSKHSNSTGSGNGKVWDAARKALFEWRFFIAVVILPTLLIALYYGIIASNQYESTAEFVVRKADMAKTNADIGQLLGFSVGTTASASEAYVVQEYLLSHDAVDHLRKENGLASMFTRDSVDLLSRLWTTGLTPERLLKYYRHQVFLQQDDMTGITHVSVRTFRPEDSVALARKLLQMGEQQVNAINQRTYNDELANARRNHDDASARLAEVEQQLTTYRQRHGDIDPADSSKAQVTMVTGLTSSLLVARARMKTIGATIDRNSPQYRAIEHQVQALEAQLAGQSSKLAGPEHSVANHLSEYEELVIKRQEVAQIFAASDIQLQQARAEVQRKQLYLIRVVEPNVPVKSEFPERFKTVLTVFASLFFAYAIGWLLWAGVKEHAM